MFPHKKEKTAQTRCLGGLSVRKTLLLIPFFLVAWIFPLSLPAHAANGKTVEITVVKNDNLVNICRKYLEDPSNWPKIGRINRLKNYDLIHPGQTLNIPVVLLKGLPVSGQVIFVKGDVAVRAGAEGPWKPSVERLHPPGEHDPDGRRDVVEIVFEDGLPSSSAPTQSST